MNEGTPFHPSWEVVLFLPGWGLGGADRVAGAVEGSLEAQSSAGRDGGA